MQSLENKVKIPTPTIVLHWPDRWCLYCYSETEEVAKQLYYCPSCDVYMAGRTEVIEGKVIYALSRDGVADTP